MNSNKATHLRIYEEALEMGVAAEAIFLALEAGLDRDVAMNLAEVTLDAIEDRYLEAGKSRTEVDALIRGEVTCINNTIAEMYDNIGQL